jgi:hypothetical protein
MSRPRWRFLITPRWLAWHTFAVFAAWGMLWLGDWQFHRAEGGNALSWAYTFEWPIFTIFGIVFWAKTIIDEWRQQGADQQRASQPGDQSQHAGHSQESGTSHRGAMQQVMARQTAVDLPAAAHIAAEYDADADDDPELAAYNAYLANLHKQVRGHGRWHGLR